LVTHPLLERAIHAVQSGQRQTARALLAQVVRQEPYNERAWLWLAASVDDDRQKLYCLQQALRINPQNTTVAQSASALAGKVEGEGEGSGSQVSGFGLRAASLGARETLQEEPVQARAQPPTPGPERVEAPTVSRRRSGRTTIDLLLFVGQRLVFGLLVLLAIIYLTYLGLEMAGGTPFGPAVREASAQTVAYVGRLVQGDLGMTSAGSDTALPRPVGEVILERLPRSLGLLGISLSFAALLSIPLGILAARGRSQRSLIVLLATLIGISVPSFFAAFLLQSAAISYTRRAGHSLLPVGGFGWDKHMILPVLVLAARPIAQITRITFVSLREVLGQDYVRTAHSKGMHPRRVMIIHVMRNAAIPILTTIAVSLRFALSSLPVVELYFGWPGVGFTLLKGISQQDDNLTVALLLCLGALFILVNLILEISYRFIDPRLQEMATRTALGERQTAREALQSAWETLQSLATENALARWFARRARWYGAYEEDLPWSKMKARRQMAVDERPARAGTGGRGTVWTTLARNVPLVIGGVLVIGLAAIVFFGPQLAPNNPAHTQGLMQVEGKFLSPPFAPGEPYPWGSDALGRGILSLVLAGARQTLTLVVLAVAARLAVGVLLGAIAGWTQGSRLDRFILGAAEVIAAFPALLLAMTVILALGIRRGMPPFIIALCFVGWGEIMQYVRAQVIAIRPQPYIESAQAVGARTPRVIARHILPHLLAALVSIAALEMGSVLMLLGELGFISIFIGGGTMHARIPGVRVLYSDVPEWGAMLSSQRFLARSYPWTALYPMLAFFASILAFNLFGEGVRRLLQEGKLIVNRLVNRYTVSATGIAAVAAIWLSTNSGVMPFYQQRAQEFDGTRALEHAVALSDPAIEGRALGSPGMDRAAEYVADQFKALGLQSGGQEDSYFQERSRSFGYLEAAPAFVIEDGGAPPTYREDYAVYPGLYVSAGQAQGPVRFVGLGQQLNVSGVVWRVVYPELERADYSGEILLTFSPREAEAVHWVPKEALFVVTDDPTHLARQFTLGSRPRETYFPWLWISEEMADRLLAPSGHTAKTLQDPYSELAAEEGFEVPTGTRVQVDVPGNVEAKWPMQNVIGYVPGTHSYDFCFDCLGKQLILVMVPYDSPPIDPAIGAIPAANDNASGVAVMLEAIRVLQETDYQPYKTMMFVAYSAEGLEGGEPVHQPDVSRFLKARPALSRLELEAVIQLRGVGGGTGKRLEIAAGGSQRLAKLLERSARRMGVRTTRAREDVDISVIYRESGSSPQSGTDAPSVRLFWEGWEASSRLPADTLENVSAENLERTGQTLALALMVLGREREY
jgi:peptide/nickel transport system permease protein